MRFERQLRQKNTPKDFDTDLATWRVFWRWVQCRKLLGSVLCTSWAWSLLRLRSLRVWLQFLGADLQPGSSFRHAHKPDPSVICQPRLRQERRVLRAPPSVRRGNAPSCQWSSIAGTRGLTFHCLVVPYAAPQVCLHVVLGSCSKHSSLRFLCSGGKRGKEGLKT